MIDKNLLNEITTEIQNLLLKKNADYGDSYFETRKEFGEVVFIIRLMDKVSWIKFQD